MWNLLAAGLSDGTCHLCEPSLFSLPVYRMCLCLPVCMCARLSLRTLFLICLRSFFCLVCICDRSASTRLLRHSGCSFVCCFTLFALACPSVRLSVCPDSLFTLVCTGLSLCLSFLVCTGLPVVSLSVCLFVSLP